MKALLDTHAFLWFAPNDIRLSANARSFMDDIGNQLFISPASYWEIAIKISVVKYALDRPFQPFFENGIELNLIEILPIEIHHVNRLLAMPHHHRDPFDRLLIAQSLAEEIPLIGKDASFDAYGIQRVW